MSELELNLTNEPGTTLHIGGISSSCGFCHRGVNPYAEKHNTILGYGKDSGTPGCGIRFTEVTSTYGHKKAVQEMRPDLPYVGLDLDES